MGVPKLCLKCFELQIQVSSDKTHETLKVAMNKYHKICTHLQMSTYRKRILVENCKVQSQLVSISVWSLVDQFQREIGFYQPLLCYD